MAEKGFRIPVTGGVNLLADPREIRDDQCVKSKNLVPTKPGVLRMRPATTDDYHLGITQYPLSALVAPPSSLADIVLTARGSAGTSLYLLDRYEGVTSTTVVSTMLCEYRPVLVPFNNKVYCFFGRPLTGSGKVVQVKADLSGPEVVDFTFTEASNTFMPAGACVYRRRMVYWNLDPGYESHILFADPDAPATVGANALAANGRNIRIGTMETGRVVGCVEIMLTAIGSPAQSALLVLKEKAAYLLVGEPNKTTDSGDMLANCTINRISQDCGCVSFETIVSTKYGVIWAGEDDVWAFQQGQIPQRIGSNISPALKDSPATLKYMWHAAYHDGFYRLAAFSVGQGPTDESSCGDQWWLDLRDGLPQGPEQARWWGPQVFLNPTTSNAVSPETPEAGTRCMFTDTRDKFDTKLMGFSPFWSSGFSLLEFGADNVRDNEGATMSAGGLYGTEIVPELLTKEYTFGDPMVDKIYGGLEISMFASLPAEVVIEAILDGGREVDTSYIEGENQAASFRAGVSTADSGLLSRQFSAFHVAPGRTSRKKGKSIQLKIYTAVGFVIDSTNDTFVFIENGSLTTARVATIAHGAYDNIKLLADALVAAMNAVRSVSDPYEHDQVVPPRSGAGLTLTITNPTDQWAPRFLTLASATSAQLLASKNLGAVLGLATESDPATALSHSATSETYYRGNYRIELGGMIVRVRTIPKRPL